MAVLSYKEFIQEVRKRISRFKADDFRDLILHLASEEPASARLVFLNKLIPREQGKQEAFPDAVRLLDEIEAFSKSVEDEVCLTILPDMPLQIVLSTIRHDANY